jgi:peptide/nickel transport system substrate-binding protein
MRDGGTQVGALRRAASQGCRRAALGALLVLSGCGGEGGAGGDTIIVGMRSDFGGFNPVTYTSLYTAEVINYALFTPIVQYDEDLQVRPHLAESWEQEGDTAVVFRLRRDVTWHDGPAVTAEDVKFTFDLAKDTIAGSLLASAFLGDVATAEVLDSFTIRFSFSRPHAQALEDFWWAPLPRHLLADVAPADLRNAPYNRSPVGSGPFRFVEWRSNERLVLERNPAFPDGLGGPAAAQRVVFRIVPEASTLLTELLTGGIHIDIPVMPDQVEQVRAAENLELFAFPGRTVYFIGWNNVRPPFDDPRVRRGLALAIDREQIIEALLAGQGELAESTIPPWSPWYPDGVTPLAHDSAAAVRALEAAGWTDVNGDGVRERNGVPLQFTMLTSDDALRRAVVEVLQSQLRRVGADVQIRVTEFQTMLQQHRSREFEAVFTNWVLDNFQVASSPFALFHSTQSAVANSANRSSVQDPALDRIMARGAAATDADDARAAWAEFTQRLQQEQPVTFMFWLTELAASNSSVQNVRMDPRGELLTIAEWSLGRE